eukprot:6201010-Pleurochrysis_carterae.AAC.4
MCFQSSHTCALAVALICTQRRSLLPILAHAHSQPLALAQFCSHSQAHPSPALAHVHDRPHAQLTVV